MPSLKAMAMNRRILVVEDEWFTADAMAGLLAKEGAAVFGAARAGRDFARS
jgi:DNA-binding response OmpR family regulator